MKSYTREGERGISITELLVVMFLMSVVGMMFFTLMTATMSKTVSFESRNDLTALGQRTINRLASELIQSTYVFEDDTIGQSYEAKLWLDTSFPRLANNRLPEILPDRQIESEQSGESFVGNSLLFVRQLEPETTNIDHDLDSNTPNIDFLVDIYEFHYYYLSRDQGATFAGQPHYLQLVKGQSRKFADYRQLAALVIGVRDQVGDQLRAQGIGFTWDRGQIATSAFYRVQASGALSLRSNYRIYLYPVEGKTESMMPQFAGGRIGGKIGYSVAQAGVSSTRGSVPVPLLAIASGEFPSGFEVTISGPNGARMIYLRLVLMAEHRGEVTAFENSVTVHTTQF